MIIIENNDIIYILGGNRMSIKIGDNNKIKKTIILDKSELSIKEKSKNNFISKHPLLIGVIISVLAGLILMFGFWTDVIKFIEELFKGG